MSVDLPSSTLPAVLIRKRSAFSFCFRSCSIVIKSILPFSSAPWSSPDHGRLSWLSFRNVWLPSSPQLYPALSWPRNGLHLYMDSTQVSGTCTLLWISPRLLEEGSHRRLV